MAVPSSGEITMKGIHQELNVNDYANAFFDSNPIKMSELFDGTEGTINGQSAAQPNPNVPQNLTEFYSYDHDATK